MGDLLGGDSYYVPYEQRPKDYGVGRRCAMGKGCLSLHELGEVGKVSRTVEPHQAETESSPLVVFCGLCENDRVRRFLDPWEYLEFGDKRRKWCTRY